VKLGFHVSISGSIDQSFDRAQLLGCTAFQVFTRNPRTWKSKQLTDEEVKVFRRKHRMSGIGFVISHMPYLPNLASPNEVIYRKSVDSLIEEVERCRCLGIRQIVTHIGSHVGAGADGGKVRIVQALGKAVDEGGPMILLENGSGSGHHMGSSLEDIAELIDAVGSSRVGFCLDTCHAYAAGYDIATKEGLTDMLRTLRKTVGFSQLRLVHLNDSVSALGSGVDHHDHIGLGKIGADGFRRILASQLAKKPMIMETPVDDRRSDAENMIKVLTLAGLSML
jgi:deoxyribonuclease IV